MFAPTYESGDNKKEEKQQEEVLAQPPLPTTTISSPVEEDYLNGPSLLSHDYLLDRYLQRLHLFLTVSGFDHGTHFRRILSWLFFGSFGVAFPFAIFITHYNTLEGLKFLSIIFVSQTILAAVSFYSISILYLQANPGGITIFGWSIDRGLINTIFFFELALVTFVLGKTVSLAST